MELTQSYLIWTASLMVSGYWIFQRQVRKDYQKKEKLSYSTSFLELLFFAFHANMIYVFIPVAWGSIPPLSEKSILHALSVICIFVGLAILLASMIPLGFQRTMGVESRQLKTSGLYKFSRNPQVVGYSIMLITYVFSYFSLYSIGWIVIFFINIHWMIQAEEEYLQKIYGEDYVKYCRKVPRYLDIRSFRNLF